MIPQPTPKSKRVMILKARVLFASLCLAFCIIAGFAEEPNPPNPTPTPNCVPQDEFWIEINPACPRYYGEPNGGYSMEFKMVGGSPLGYHYAWYGLGECGGQDSVNFHRATAHRKTPGTLAPFMKVWKPGCDESTAITVNTYRTNSYGDPGPIVPGPLEFKAPVFVDTGFMTFENHILAQTQKLTGPPCTVDTQTAFNNGYFHHDARLGQIVINGQGKVNAMNPEAWSANCNVCASFGEAVYDDASAVSAAPGTYTVKFPSSAHAVQWAWETYRFNQSSCLAVMESNTPYSGPQREATIYQVALESWIHPEYPPEGETVEVGCVITPGSVKWANQQTSGANWSAQIEIWDPSAPNLKRIAEMWLSDGENTISFQWDGNLYDCEVPARLQASDYFMKITANFRNRTANPPNFMTTISWTEPKIAIKSPNRNNKFVYNSNQQGVCSIICELTASTSDLESQLGSSLPEFSITDIPNVILQFVRDPFYSYKGVLSYNNLPYYVTNFGRKTVSVNHILGSSSQNVFVFFDPVATNHPNINPLGVNFNPQGLPLTGMANQHYYYLQILQPDHDLIFLKTASLFPFSTGFNDEDESIVELNLQNSIPNINATYYVSLIYHENFHYDDYKLWWPSGYFQSLDSDLDFAPNNWEQSPPGLYHIPQSIYTMLEEVITYANHISPTSIVWEGSWYKDPNIQVGAQGNTVRANQWAWEPGLYEPNKNYLEKRGSNAQNFYLENYSQLQFDWSSGGWLFANPDDLENY